MKAFKIVEKSLGGLSVIEIENKLNGEYVNIIPNYGGAINELVLQKNEKLYSIHKFAKNLTKFQQEFVPMYAGTFLAPFPNRIKNGAYMFNSIEHQLELTDIGLPNALHGFLYKKSFTINNVDEINGTLCLDYYFKGDKGYPFKIYFKNTYQLKEGALLITSFVKNESENSIPFGMGWHPYICTGTPIDLLQLKISGRSYFEQDKQFIPTGRLTECPDFQKIRLISNRFMNDCYIFKDSGKTSIYDSVKGLNIIIDQQIGEKAYNYCMYYTPPKRDCIAIEPMTSAPDAFNNHHGFFRLDKREELELDFSIVLK